MATGHNVWVSFGAQLKQTAENNNSVSEVVGTLAQCGDTKDKLLIFRCDHGSMTVYIKAETALAGVAQWIEHRPVNQRVASSIPSQGTCLGCGPGP